MDEREKIVKAYLETVPVSKQGIFERAFDRHSRTAAIKAKCIDCVAFELPSENIGECKAYTCPLWSYRPYQDGDVEDAPESL